MAFPQQPHTRPSAALPRPAAPVTKKRVLQLVNPDTKEAVDLASVAKEASKLQVCCHYSCCSGSKQKIRQDLTSTYG